jgi:crotonobetainyl-CoA:carnitine CoA-transferase CaiB-like acyl-CoA transferase
MKSKSGMPTGALEDIRVLDLADEKGMVCGAILSGLGADVIKVEKPGGDDPRRPGPFYKDEVDLEKSLYWFSFNTDKRGITLNIETKEGRDLFRKLVQRLDIVIESFPLGHLDQRGLGYADLNLANPKIIMTSISPFGQKGPYSGYKGGDITVWALGGLMNQTGDPDRPPLQVSLPQSYIASGTYAAEGTLMALYARDLGGQGQHVDVSAMETIAWIGAEAFPFWFALNYNKPRVGGKITRTGGIHAPQIWPCKDGYVSYLIQVGRPGAERNARMAEWLEQEGLATDFIRNTDWMQLDWMDLVKDGIERLAEPLGKLFRTRTMKDLFNEALQRNITLYPVANSRDLLENEQLKRREFWVNLEHPELADTITYPGPFAVLSETPVNIGRRAPLIGEHNQEIYHGELEISLSELQTLSKKGII